MKLAMGMWQRTLFYLGLVDEDDPYYDTEYQPEPGREAPVGRPDPSRRAGAPPRRTSGGLDPALTTGERMAARRHTERIEPPRTGVKGRRVEPPMVSRRRPMADRALSEAGVVVTPGESVGGVRPSESDLDSEVIVARSYSDAQLLADHIRASIPVVLDLRKVEPAMVRRLVDFSSGLTYALGGSMRKIGQGVVLVTPANVNISRDERRRLRELGYHEAPEES